MKTKHSAPAEYRFARHLVGALVFLGTPLLYATEKTSPDGIEPGGCFRFGIYEFRWENDPNRNKMIDSEEVSYRQGDKGDWKLLQDETLFKNTVEARRQIRQDPQPGIPYKHVPGRDLTAHIHYPKGWKPSDRRPAIIWFHGGGFAGGTPRQFERFAVPFTELGIVNIRVGYRLTSIDGSENAGAHNAAKDGRSAIRWVRKNASTLGIDPQKIIAAGDSAGGALALGTLLEHLNDESDTISIDAQPNAVMGESTWVLMHKSGMKNQTIPWPVLDLPALPPIWLGYGGKDVGYKPGSPLGGEAFVRALNAKMGNRLSTHFVTDGDHGYGFRPQNFGLCLDSMKLFLTDHGYLPVTSDSATTP